MVLLYYCNTLLAAPLGYDSSAAAYTKHRQCVCGSKVQGRVHPEDVSMRNEPRYALEMSQVSTVQTLRDF